MKYSSSFALVGDVGLYRHFNQPVLVKAGVLESDAVIVFCDVVCAAGGRDGTAVLAGRQAEVFQRYPGYDPSYEWVFLDWSEG